MCERRNRPAGDPARKNAEATGPEVRGIGHWPAFLILGLKPGSSRGSTLRRMASRLTILLICFLAYEVLRPEPLESEIRHIYLFVLLWSATFFVFTVAAVIYLGGTTNAFRPAPFRLIIDIFLSGAVSILGFALLYRGLGLLDTRDWSTVVDKSDFVYFSVVTFSTLGYGDFRAVEGVRIWAALQAIYGNVHLGMLAGAVFFALDRSLNDRTGPSGN